MKGIPNVGDLTFLNMWGRGEYLFIFRIRGDITWNFSRVNIATFRGLKLRGNGVKTALHARLGVKSPVKMSGP